MTLNLAEIAEQVEMLGRQLAERAGRQRQALPALRALRSRYAHEGERLRALAESPAGRDADCAVPTEEPLDAVFAAPKPPERATILAADGSQIYPDAHGWALYYLINIGSLIYRHGSGQAPQASSDPTVAYAADGQGNPLTREQLNARRDVAELTKLADLAEAVAADGTVGAGVIALLDSTIGLRAWAGAIPLGEQKALQQRYAAQLERLRRAGAALAGVVSRSRRAGVVHLLDLAQQEEVARNGASSSLSHNAPQGEVLPSPFRGLTDTHLWGDLKPGERSALFVEEKGGLRVYFFYLNTTPPGDRPEGEAEPARIEIPEWVACNEEQLHLVHALVYDQCCLNNGYPYALSRADELAIILNEEQEALETMLLQAMSRRGMPLPRLSPKAAQKRVVRAPFHRW